MTSIDEHISELKGIFKQHYMNGLLLKRKEKRSGIAGIIDEWKDRYEKLVDASEREYMFYRVLSGRGAVADELEKYVNKCFKEAREDWTLPHRAEFAIELEKKYQFYSRAAPLMFGLRQTMLNVNDILHDKKRRRKTDYDADIPFLNKALLRARCYLNNMGFLQGRNPVEERVREILYTPGYGMGKN